ncbi:MAG: RNA-binding S4 domain-containing protein [Planctomycetota bacterium]|nr:RNA-binding S4 domain-containing protein [Planctomycetota bacterium]
MTEPTGEPTIRLDHFLQICGVQTGGQAKQLIQGGVVYVNNELETRRRKKLVIGDVVTIDGEEFEVQGE